MERQRGRILRRNWDKSLKSFPLAIQSHNYTNKLSKIGMKLVCNVNIVYGNLKSENSQEYAQNLNDIVRSWIRLRIICPLKLRGRKVWLNQVACSAVSTTTT
jgi:hypothetical protein